jgi:hypothetical protein
MKSGFSVTRRVLAVFSVAAACALVCDCSSTTYPAVLSDPPPPNDTTLSPDQVKKAMDNLISDRNRQCSEAIAEKAPDDPPPDCGVTTTGATPNTGAAAKP